MHQPVETDEDQGVDLNTFLRMKMREESIWQRVKRSMERDGLWPFLNMEETSERSSQ